LPASRAAARFSGEVIRQRRQTYGSATTAAYGHRFSPQTEQVTSRVVGGVWTWQPQVGHVTAR
jgi:hypothetical protein